MSELTHLSDADLDAVTGGGHSFTFALGVIQSNIAVTSQSSTNVAVLTAFTKVGGGQFSSTYQSNSIG
jgi:hypothetical protein